MALAGLDTLYQNMGPAGASFIAGQREAQAKQQADLEEALNAQKLRQEQQDYSQKEVMNPLNAQYRQGEVAAQGPALEQAQTTAAKGKATMSSDIAAKQAQNEGTIDEEKLKHVANIGRMGGIIAARLQGVPPPAQAAAAMQMLQEQGIDPNSKIGQHIIKTPPEVLMKQSQAISMMTDQAVQHMAQQKAAADSAQKLEQMRIEAGKYTKAVHGAQEAIEKALSAGKWDQASTAYDRLAQIAHEKGDNENALYYQQKSKEYADKYVLSHKPEQPGGVDLNKAAGLPVNPNPSTAAPALKGEVKHTEGTTKSGVKYKVLPPE
jgi:HEPN domain-containing protein